MAKMPTAEVTISITQGSTTGPLPDECVCGGAVEFIAAAPQSPMRVRCTNCGIAIEPDPTEQDGMAHVGARWRKLRDILMDVACESGSVP